MIAPAILAAILWLAIDVIYVPWRRLATACPIKTPIAAAATFQLFLPITLFANPLVFLTLGSNTVSSTLMTHIWLSVCV